MILAAAQTNPIRGNISKNLENHYLLIKKAAEKGADLIAFPEMSITGYEREDGDRLSFSKNDSRLELLQELANKNNIIIIAGAPIKAANKLFIGSFIISPNKPMSIYTKQFLHTSEDEFYDSSFDYNPRIEFDDEVISLAICADIDNPLHAENACNAESTIYIPSIFFSLQGLPDAYTKLSSYAKSHSMCVLMSNFAGELLDRSAGGKSAFWNNKGEMIVALDDSNTGLLVVEKSGNDWAGQTFVL